MSIDQQYKSKCFSNKSDHGWCAEVVLKDVASGKTRVITCKSSDETPQEKMMASPSLESMPQMDDYGSGLNSAVALKAVSTHRKTDSRVVWERTTSALQRQAWSEAKLAKREVEV